MTSKPTGVTSALFVFALMTFPSANPYYSWARDQEGWGFCQGANIYGGYRTDDKYCEAKQPSHYERLALDSADPRCHRLTPQRYILNGGRAVNDSLCD